MVLNNVVYFKMGLAVAAVGALLAVLFVSRGRRGELAGETREYGFIMPILMPAGLHLGEKIKGSWGSAYDAKIRGKIAELFSQRNIEKYYRIHHAQRMALAAFVLTACCVVLAIGDADLTVYPFAIIVTGLSWYWTDRQLDKKISRRKREILIDLPVFINTLALLINAGLPYTAALQKAVSSGKLGRPLYREFRTLIADTSTGRPLNLAYEEVAMRCRAPEITRFVSTILQNLHRGDADMVLILRDLAREAWERRKDIARKQGEEAAAKLVFPMVMVFLAVAIIVIAPAVITMSR